MKRRYATLKTLAWLLISSISGLFVGLAGIYLYLSPSLPSIDTLRDVKLQTPLSVFTVDGKLIGQFGEKRRVPIRYNEIPQHYVNALLAAEDDQFYSHSGVSIKGLIRASTELLMSGDIVSGGSTITMQVARNFFLTKRQTFKRKFNEILLALEIEQALSKQEILELYVNVIFLGNRAYGIQAAAQAYYGKNLPDLSLAQVAMLAGIPKAPSKMNPLANPERAKQRRDWILQRMQALGKITEDELALAIAEEVSASYHGSKVDFDAPYIAEMARKELISLFGTKAYTDGYSVITTVDSALQQAAQRAVVDGLIAYDKRHGFRGAERQLDGTDESDNQSLESTLSESETGEVEDSESIVASETDRQRWHETLQPIADFGGLTPAVVVAVEEKSFSAIMRDGSAVSISWENGISGARPYITPNRRGSSPKTAFSVVNLGDVVRLQNTEEGWQLAQIPAAQGALVSLHAETGAILALVGGFDFRQSKFNRATQASRQPGSNFKPFVYVRALESGMTAATLINDAPIIFDDDELEQAWRPENSSGKFYGPTRLRKALYLSRNLVSIRVLREIGIQNTIEGMARFGFDAGALPKNLSLALGSHAMPPIAIANGYATFANGGYRVQPYWIKEIYDSEGSLIYQAKPQVACTSLCDNTVESEATTQLSLSDPYLELKESDSGPLGSTDPLDDKDEPLAAITEETLKNRAEELQGELEETNNYAPRIVKSEHAFIIDSMLKDVIRRGTGTKAKALNRTDIGGKTGTTNGPTDAWFSGYGGGVVTTTWVGFDNNGLLGSREYGGVAALPIWIDYMRTALEQAPEQKAYQPASIVTVKIDPVTGRQAGTNNRSALFEFFSADSLPPAPETSDIPVDIFTEPSDGAPPTELF